MKKTSDVTLPSRRAKPRDDRVGAACRTCARRRRARRRRTRPAPRSSSRARPRSGSFCLKSVTASADCQTNVPGRPSTRSAARCASRAPDSTWFPSCRWVRVVGVGCAAAAPARAAVSSRVSRNVHGGLGGVCRMLGRSEPREGLGRPMGAAMSRSTGRGRMGCRRALRSADGAREHHGLDERGGGAASTPGTRRANARASGRRRRPGGSVARRGRDRVQPRVQRVVRARFAPLSPVTACGRTDGVTARPHAFRAWRRELPRGVRVGERERHLFDLPGSDRDEDAGARSRSRSAPRPPRPSPSIVSNVVDGRGRSRGGQERQELLRAEAEARARRVFRASRPCAAVEDRPRPRDRRDGMRDGEVRRSRRRLVRLRGARRRCAVAETGCRRGARRAYRGPRRSSSRTAGRETSPAKCWAGERPSPPQRSELRRVMPTWISPPQTPMGRGHGAAFADVVLEQQRGLDVPGGGRPCVTTVVERDDGAVKPASARSTSLFSTAFFTTKSCGYHVVQPGLGASARVAAKSARGPCGSRSSPVTTARWKSIARQAGPRRCGEADAKPSPASPDRGRLMRAHIDARCPCNPPATPRCERRNRPLT